MINLSDLQVNQRAKILRINTESLGVDFTRDLLDYGLIPGSSVIVKKVHKSSGKLIIFLNGIDIALRLKDAAMIQVELNGK
ncbi:MAG: ferrous iron transport protein A [Leptospiraceae bacterium]|nr:ferrous iron transport protein A [Leptospiraceae bacterium]